MHANLPTLIIISLYYFCKKVFILMNIWMTRKNSMKHQYFKKKSFIVTLIWKILSVHAKRVWKDVEIKNSGKHHDCYVQNNTLLLADVCV